MNEAFLSICPNGKMADCGQLLKTEFPLINDDLFEYVEGIHHFQLLKYEMKIFAFRPIILKVYSFIN